MILCVTPNAALDCTMVVPGFRPGEIVRPDSMLMAAGGKGVNVARTVKTLGGEVACAGFVAGHLGEMLVEHATAEGLHGRWTHIEGETRMCLIIVDPQADPATSSTVINGTGPQTTPEHWTALIQDALAAGARAEYVCVSGSLPPGSDLESYGTLIRAFAHQGKQVWVDTSGATLRYALRLPVAGIKVNRDEAGEILHSVIHSATDAIRAGAHFRAESGANIVITLGKDGAVAVNETAAYSLPGPAVKAISAVGSGDAFMGGLVCALSRGHNMAVALRWAVCAGACNAQAIGGGMVDLELFDALLKMTALPQGVDLPR